MWGLNTPRGFESRPLRQDTHPRQCTTVQRCAGPEILSHCGCNGIFRPDTFKDALKCIHVPIALRHFLADGLGDKTVKGLGMGSKSGVAKLHLLSA